MAIQDLGSNIRRQMKLQGLTIPELASRIGMGTAAVSNLLNGKTEPKSSTLIKLAEALGVSFPDLLAPAPRLDSLRFRTARSLSGREKASRDQLLHDTALWLANYRLLEELVKDKSEYLLSPSGFDSPNTAAVQVRKGLGLDGAGPVHNSIGLMDEAGIKLRIRPFGFRKTFGLSIGQADGGPAIIINSEAGISIERQIFTIAHELGHLVLHKESYAAGREEEIDVEEAEADSFAGRFLVPDEGLRATWEALRGLHWIDAVLRAKKEYKVSYQTILHRLKDLYPALRVRQLEREFAVQYNVRFGHDLKDHYEPEALSSSDLVESRFLGLVRTALETEAISMSRAAEMLGIGLDQMSKRAMEWRDGV
jgi:Zn-dependent peptidase ImmA (M78 family)/transcriptional regulator with XRE-family HTH domain